MQAHIDSEVRTEMNRTLISKALIVVCAVVVIAGNPLWGQSTTGRSVLEVIPPNALFVVRVNNLAFTLGQFDQFLAGVLPIPMGTTMLVQMQLAELLGNPAATGVNMNGDFAIYGTVAGEMEPKLCLLIPVTDYQQFLSASANIGLPDANGVAKSTTQGANICVIGKSNYAVMSLTGDYEELIKDKVVSENMATALKNELPGDAPAWAYVNMQLVSKAYGPMLLGVFAQVKQTVSQEAVAEQTGQDPEMTAGILDAYLTAIETFLTETRSITATVRPTPDVLLIQEKISALPGTAMAGALVKSTPAASGNPLLGYLENGAAVNFAGRMDNPIWKKLNEFFIGLFGSMVGEADTTAMKALARESLDAAEGPMVFSMKFDPNAALPLSGRYALVLKDPAKFDEIMDKSAQMMTTGSIHDFYQKLGMDISFNIERGAATHSGVSINKATFAMKSADPQSPQGQVIEQMYGEGIQYRWATVGKTSLWAIGSKAEMGIRELIDIAKAGGPKGVCREVQAALTALPEADKADLMVTLNCLRFMKMIQVMMTKAPGMPAMLPSADLPTKSNMVMTANVGDGSITFDTAIPKQHLMEIMGAFMMMQQQMMQQQMQQNQQQATP